MLEDNWEAWLATGLRILLIVVIALVVRAAIRRAISRLIARMNREGTPRRPTARAGRRLGQPASSERRRQRAAAIGSVLRSAASVLVLGTAVLMVLSQLGIQLGPLVASAGIVGVAIGFGAQRLVADVLSGMFMLLEDQYGVGDRIDAGEATGTVLEIGLRITTLRGDGGEIWYVRNGEISRIGNLSQGWSTAEVEVLLAPDANVEDARKAIATAGEAMSDAEPWDELLWEPPQVLGLESVSAEALVLKVTAKTLPGSERRVERELRWRITQALDAAGVDRLGGSGLGSAGPSPTGAG